MCKLGEVGDCEQALRTYAISLRGLYELFHIKIQIKLTQKHMFLQIFLFISQFEYL